MLGFDDYSRIKPTRFHLMPVSTVRTKRKSLAIFGRFYPMAFYYHRKLRKNIAIYVDNSLIYNVAYHKDLGNIIGINFNFVGSGYIDYCKLTDANGENIINDTFEN